jgi:hypothetical protein
MDYQAFLAREGRPLHLQEGHPVEYWGALRMGSVKVNGVLVSWDQFSLRLQDALDFDPFVEDQPAMDLDMALCAFGESVRGAQLRAEDCMSLIGGGVIRQEGPRNTVMTLVGWWTVVYPTTGWRSSIIRRWNWLGSY